MHLVSSRKKTVKVSGGGCRAGGNGGVHSGQRGRQGSKIGWGELKCTTKFGWVAKCQNLII